MSDKYIYVLLAVAVVAVIAVIVFITIRRGGGLSCAEVESLGMADVIKVFKKPEVLQKLKSNKTYIAVAIKETLDDGSAKIVATTFDNEKNKVVSTPFCAWKAKKLEADLLEAFGDKSMIILQ